MSGLAGGGPGAGAADAELAAGPESLVLVTNKGVHLRDKGGGLIDKMALDGEFFTSASPHKVALPHIGDPDVIYDQRADRFWIVAIEVDFADFYNRGWMHVAVSTTDTHDDLDEDWIKFAVDIKEKPKETLFDGVAHFLNIATDDDYLYVACTDSVPQNTALWRTTVVIMEKASILNNMPPDPEDLEFVRLHEVSETWGHGIGRLDSTYSTTEVMYLVAPPSDPSKENMVEQTHLNVVVIYRDGPDWVPMAISLELPESHFNTGGTAETPPPPTGCGTSGHVHLVASACIHAVQYGQGKGASLWTTLHCRRSDGEKEPAALAGEVVRWYEISLNGWPFEKDEPEFRQWGQVDGLAVRPAWHTFDPSLAVNSRGDMALTYTQSGDQTGQHTRTMHAYRCAGDTLDTLPNHSFVAQSALATINTMMEARIIKADYSGTSMDPEDDDVFWSHSVLTLPVTGVCPTEWETWLAEHVIDCSESARGCYADCDMQSGPGVLDIFDFLCFGNRFSAGDPYACDCDTSTGLGVCDIFDFLCFGNAFSVGCNK